MKNESRAVNEPATNVIRGVVGAFTVGAAEIVTEPAKVPLLVFAFSSCAFNAAMAADAFGSGGGIGLPNLVCNFTTYERSRIRPAIHKFYKKLTTLLSEKT